MNPMKLTTPATREALIWATAVSVALSEGKTVTNHESGGSSIEADRSYILTLIGDARKVVDGTGEAPAEQPPVHSGGQLKGMLQLLPTIADVRGGLTRPRKRG